MTGKRPARKAAAKSKDKAVAKLDRETLVDIICERIAAGQAMYLACNDTGLAESTFRFWAIDDAAVAAKYARAREARAEVRAEQIDEIASKVESGEIPPDVGRVVIDARKWAASKLAPRRYSDKMDVTHGGEVGLTVVVRKFGAD